MSAVEVMQAFQGHVDSKEFGQAAQLLADNAEISTPFGMKTKAQFLQDLQGSGPTWSAIRPGNHERQCVTQGVRKMGFIKIQLKRLVDINEEGKLQTIVITKQ